jgi:hypothetical protein
MAGNPPDIMGPSLVRLIAALVEQHQSVVRLTENHYLVRWQPRSDLWCVINMAAPDRHGDSCATFRFGKRCEHLDLIGQLCSEERQLAGKVGG